MNNFPKTWISAYPAKYIGMVNFNTPVFELWLGFDVLIRHPVVIDLPTDGWENSKKVFLQRRIENILTNAKEILVDVFWSNDNGIYSHFDIEVDRVDIIDHLERFL